MRCSAAMCFCAKASAATRWSTSPLDPVLRRVAGVLRPFPMTTRPALPNFARRLQAGQPVKLVGFGDSITGIYYHTGGRRAWPEILGGLLRAACPPADLTVINAGVSGNTAAHALDRIERDVFAHRPDLVAVQLGMND